MKSTSEKIGYCAGCIIGGLLIYVGLVVTAPLWCAYVAFDKVKSQWPTNVTFCKFGNK